MEQHLSIETLSAYVDEEYSGEELALLEDHLRECRECDVKKTALQTAVSSLASLEQPVLSNDEHRELRQKLIGSVQRSGGKWKSNPRWLLAGGLATVILVAVGLASVRSQLGLPKQSEDRAQTMSFAFESDGQIREVVVSHPEVIQAVKRFRVADSRPPEDASSSAKSRSSGGPAPTSDEAGPAPVPVAGPTAPAPGTADGGSGGQENQPQELSAPEASDQSQSQQAAPPVDFSAAAGQQCLQKVRAAQPHAMVGILAKPATYKSRPAWLLTYAWTQSKNPTAKLDQIQIWLIPPQECATLEGPELLSKALHYSFLKP